MKLTWDTYDDPDNPTEPESSLVKEPDPPPSPGLFYGPDDSMEREYEEPELPEPKPERPHKNDWAIYNTLREGFLKALGKCRGAGEQTKEAIYYALGRSKIEQEGVGLSNEKVHSMGKKTLEELTAAKLKKIGCYDHQEFLERVQVKESIILKPTTKNLVMDRGTAWTLFDTLTKLTRDQRAVLWFLVQKLRNTEKPEERKEPFYFTPKELQNALEKKNFLAWQIKDALDALGKITIPYVWRYREKRWDKEDLEIEEGTREQMVQPYWKEVGEIAAKKNVPEEHRTKWLFGARFGGLFQLVVISNLLEKRYRLIPIEAFKLKDRAEIAFEYFLLHEADQRSRVVRISYETFWKIIFMTSEPEYVSDFIVEIKKTLNILEKRMKVYWGKKGRGMSAVFYLSKSKESLDFCHLRNTHDSYGVYYESSY